MRIICNRPSGFIFPGLKIQPGENFIDDQLWAEIEPKLNPKWLAALTTPRGEKPAEIVLLDDAQSAPALNAKDTIALIERCQTIDELEQYEQDEARKTVLTAIERRMAALIEADDAPGD